MSKVINKQFSFISNRIIYNFEQMWPLIWLFTPFLKVYTFFSQWLHVAENSI
jgi:hypothetical protein